MLKAFTPVAVLIFSFFAGLEKTTMTEIYIVMLICIGKIVYMMYNTVLRVMYVVSCATYH